MPKGGYWHATDAEARKRGEQTGLDTLVVHAVNDGHWIDVGLSDVGRSKCVQCPAWGVWSQG